MSIPLGLSGDKIWREKLFLGLVQIEINLCTLLSICTKHRKSFSRQIFPETNQVESTIFLCGTKNIVLVLKIYQNANSPQGCGLYFAKYSPQPASNIPHGEFLSTVNLNFVPVSYTHLTLPTICSV